MRWTTDAQNINEKIKTHAQYIHFYKQQTHKSGGVVILDGLGISEGLHDGIGLQELLLQLPLVMKAIYKNMALTHWWIWKGGSGCCFGGDEVIGGGNGLGWIQQNTITEVSNSINK